MSTLVFAAAFEQSFTGFLAEVLQLAEDSQLIRKACFRVLVEVGMVECLL